MKKRVFIVMEPDLASYPPTISLLNVLLDLNYSPYYIGYYSDNLQKENFEKRGVTFLETVPYATKGGLLDKLKSILKFKKQATNYLRDNVQLNEQVWLFGGDTICALSKLVEKYNTVLMFYEFIKPVLNVKYKLIFPKYDLGKTMRAANAVVHCEYNRAQISMAMYGLKNSPFVLPNKPYNYEGWDKNVPTEIEETVDSLKKRINGRKVILYQGLFNSNERRLEEFCQAMDLLPKDIMFIAMGKGSDYYEKLKAKYQSDRILFIPFIKPPYHLLVTQLSSIGVMTYFARSTNFADVINPIYCAPNKIFEYSQYKIPMLCNDIPGLHFIFEKYECGISIPQPMTAVAIADSVKRVFDDFEHYSNGSYYYYNSVDIKSIINDILSKTEK